jgi:hypothetical protein
MSELDIEIKVREKNFKISLNLMTAQIEDQIPPEVWTRDRNWATDSPNLYCDIFIL